MTAIFDVLVETNDIVVLGPPTNIDVAFDIGSQGQRGSRFFVGSGNPNNPGVIPEGQDLLVGDIFINSSTSNQNGWLYLYIQTPSGKSWTPALRLQPSIYSSNISTLFNNGTANVSIPISNILPDIFELDKEKYIVQVTAINSNPVALSITSKDIQGPNLTFSIKGAQYSGSPAAWSNLSGTFSLQITITVI